MVLALEIKKFYNKHNPEGIENGENLQRVDRMLERLEVLYLMRDQTIEEIAKIRTEQDFKEALDPMDLATSSSFGSFINTLVPVYHPSID